LSVLGREGGREGRREGRRVSGDGWMVVVIPGGDHSGRGEGGREGGRERTYQLVGVSMGTPRPAEPVSISTSTVWSPARKEEGNER
jgi:hypothetical protein